MVNYRNIGLQQDKEFLLRLLCGQDSHCHGLRRQCSLPRPRLCGKYRRPIYSPLISFMHIALNSKHHVYVPYINYQADNVPEGRRASTFGILSGISSSAFVCGTLFTRFVSTPSTFQVLSLSDSLSSSISIIFICNHRI